ncbi:MAG: hypothetical protein ACJAYF_001308 [Arenicella sp.]|jgi:hypothetical protein
MTEHHPTKLLAALSLLLSLTLATASADVGLIESTQTPTVTSRIISISQSEIMDLTENRPLNLPKPLISDKQLNSLRSNSTGGDAVLGAAPYVVPLIVNRSRTFVTITEEDDIEIGEYLPWYTGNADTFRCTATLIDPYWVLTAAHCVSNYRNPGFGDFIGIQEFEVKIRVNSLNWATGGRTVNVAETFIHPNWTRQVFSDGTWVNNPSVWMGDIALLRLAEPVTDVSDADFYVEDPNDFETSQKTYGWGVTQQGIAPESLQGWNSDLVNDSVCANTDETGTYIHSEMSCFDALDGLGACGGDSGSAIGIIDNGWGITGVASYMIFTGATNSTSTRCDDPRLVAYTTIGGAIFTWIDYIIQTETPAPTHTPVTIEIGGNYNMAAVMQVSCGTPSCTLIGNRPRGKSCSISCPVGNTVTMSCASNNANRPIDDFEFTQGATGTSDIVGLTPIFGICNFTD